MSIQKSKFSHLFPYDKPRECQIDAMDTIEESNKKGGVVVMEGACGTGKTLAAKIPKIDFIRDDDTIGERILIVTSVKQQMEAFKNEVQRINDNLDEGQETVTALAISGVKDLHPFVRDGLITENHYNKIDSLRKGTRDLVQQYDETYEYLVKNARGSSGKGPYEDKIPSVDGISYDPYYAEFKAKSSPDEDNKDVIPFSTNSSGLISQDDLYESCIKTGICPHSIMRIALENVEIVIGNYAHVFDPKTVDLITAPIMEKETLAIFDEAHNLVSRVRDFLSTEITSDTIEDGISELKELRMMAELGSYDSKEIKMLLSALEKYDKDNIPSNMSQYEDLINRLRELNKLDNIVTTRKEEYIENSTRAAEIIVDMDLTLDDLDSHINYFEAIAEFTDKVVDKNTPVYDEDTIELRDPESPSEDRLTLWTQMHSEFTTDLQEEAEVVGEASYRFRDECTEEQKTVKSYARSTGKFFKSWYDKDYVKYYREIEMVERYQKRTGEEYKWKNSLRPKLVIRNCIPREEIADVISTFNSSVLMSATLEPLDVYTYETGVNILNEEDGTPIYECQYGLSFPEENRETIAVSADEFMWKNRKHPFEGDEPQVQNETRSTYRDIVFDVVSETPGKVLIAMPSYAEAKWIGKLLKQTYMITGRKIIIDESSTNQETTKLRREFFNSDNGVLVTCARGTLTEGVDYEGDKLSSAVVCGVPLVKTDTNHQKAIKAAYRADFDIDGISGFELAFTIDAVRKARQTIGRVIRSNSDVGTRIFVDKRFTISDDGWGVKPYLSPNEQSELDVLYPEALEEKLEEFWN